MKAIPESVSEIWLVGCGIGDIAGVAILDWMKQSANLQMICMEQNNFSTDFQQGLYIFKKQNPQIMVVT